MKKENNPRWTGSGYCHNPEIGCNLGCDLMCERCVYNKSIPKKDKK
jgi:hypothetical protein